MEVPCPKLINDHNNYLGGVDKNDQLAVVCKKMKHLVGRKRTRQERQERGRDRNGRKEDETGTAGG